MNHIRPTSRIAWQELQDSGLLTGMRERVAQCVYNHGPLTANELEAKMKRPNEVAPSYHKRLSELEKMDVIERITTRACSVTGKQCEVWEITGRVPRALPKSVSTNETPTKRELREAVDELRAIATESANAGKPFSSNLIRVCKWLKTKSE